MEQLPNEMLVEIRPHVASPRDVSSLQMVCRDFSVAFDVREWLREIAARCGCSSPMCAGLWNVDAFTGDRAMARLLAGGNYEAVHAGLHCEHTRRTIEEKMPCHTGAMVEIERLEVDKSFCTFEASMEVIVGSILFSSDPHVRNAVVCYNDGGIVIGTRDGSVRFAMPRAFPLALAHGSDLVVLENVEQRPCQLKHQSLPLADWDDFFGATQYLRSSDGKNVLHFENGLVSILAE